MVNSCCHDDRCRNLRFALEAELEVSTALRLEIEEMKRAQHVRQERDAEKIRSVSRCVYVCGSCVCVCVHILGAHHLIRDMWHSFDTILNHQIFFPGGLDFQEKA